MHWFETLFDTHEFFMSCIGLRVVEVVFVCFHWFETLFDTHELFMCRIGLREVEVVFVIVLP